MKRFRKKLKNVIFHKNNGKCASSSLCIFSVDQNRKLQWQSCKSDQLDSCGCPPPLLGHLKKLFSL